MNNDLLTYIEAAEILGVAPNTVCQYCKPGRKKRLDRPYPRAPLVTRESVERYAAERRAYLRQAEATEPASEAEVARCRLLFERTEAAEKS
jgi:hypothetical protein